MDLKKNIRFIVLILMKIISIVYTYSLVNKIKRYKRKIFTYWILDSFKHVGEQISIENTLNLRGGKFISLGNNVEIGKFVILAAWDEYLGEKYQPEIMIGDNSIIGDYCHLTSIVGIKIGNNVLFGRNITVTDNSHGSSDAMSLEFSPMKRKLNSKGSIEIGDGVWIGDKVTILPNVKIGENAIIGANALVTKDVPANTIVGGVPAKIIKIINL